MEAIQGYLSRLCLQTKPKPSQARWHIVFGPSLRRHRQSELYESLKPTCLHGESQASQSYAEKYPLLKTKKTKTPTNIMTHVFEIPTETEELQLSKNPSGQIETSSLVD